MTADAGFLEAIIDSPEDDAPRLIYADWLEENGQPCSICQGAGKVPPPYSGGVPPEGTRCKRCHGSGRVPGSERAEFIRVQCELHRITAGGFIVDEPAIQPRIDALRRRERALLNTMQAAGPDRPPRTCTLARYAWAGAVARLNDPDGTGWQFRRGFVEQITCTPQDWERHGPSVVQAQPVVEVRFPMPRFLINVGSYSVPVWVNADIAPTNPGAGEYVEIRRTPGQSVAEFLSCTDLAARSIPNPLHA